MFERFDPDARAAIAKAREEAAKAGHREIGTEHLLLGLMDEPGDATDVLEAVKADPEEVRAAVPQMEAIRAATGEHRIVQATPADEAQPGEPPSRDPAAGFDMRLTRNARRALDLALRTAHRFRHDNVSSGHLLLGIIEQPDSGAAETLKVAGIHVGTLRTDILKQLTEAPAKPAPKRASPASAEPVPSSTAEPAPGRE